MCDWLAPFICISDSPHSAEDDPRAGYANTWQIGMKHAPNEDMGWCLYGAICSPCAQYQLRTMALEGDMSKYKCCQGYFSLCCFDGMLNGMAKSMPEVCLCAEVWCCGSCSLSGTRMYLQDNRNIVSDPCDNRIIRFNNCMQLLSCILNIVANFVDGLDSAADIVDLIAALVYCVTSGCMTAQMHYEMTHVNGEPILNTGAPETAIMER